MKYLVLDAYIRGTGVRDTISNEYIEITRLNLPDELLNELSRWKDNYYLETKSSKSQKEKIEAFKKLDATGLALSRKILEQLDDIKIDYYFSDFTAQRIYLNVSTK